MRGVSSGVAADLRSAGFAELAGRRAGTARDVGIRSGLIRPRARKAAVAKLISVITTALAIAAGPGLASLLENPLPARAPYNSGFQLRGSIAFNSDLRLRGSIR